MRYVNNGQAGYAGTLGAQAGNNSYGLVFGSYEGHVGRTAADVNSFVWSKIISSGTGTSSPEINNKVGPHVDSLGNVYAFGQLRYQVGGSNTNQGYVVKFDPSGNVLWQRGFKVEPLAITSGAQTNRVNGVTSNADATEIYVTLVLQLLLLDKLYGNCMQMGQIQTNM